MVRAPAAAAPCTGKQQCLLAATLLAATLRLLAAALAAALASEAAAAAAAARAASVQSTPPALDLRRYDALSRLNLGRFGAETALLA